ncbi:hypothetical protein G9A89_006583 [Geosiphon pyriformis]|nr:hypothetical protein G9A89_006583 [Geosiphon pyriformis]
MVDWKNEIKVPFQFNRITKRSQSFPKILLDPEIGFLPLYKTLAYLASDAYCDLGNRPINVKNFPTYDDVRVNKPVLELIESTFPTILKNIRKYLQKNPKTIQIFFIGHALAYASIAGIRWAMEEYAITKSNLWPEIDMEVIGAQIITFGAPRIGNSRFSKFANMVVPHHRITHGNDHVPHSPLTPLEWNHFGFEIWIEPSENCNCSNEDHPYSYWDCNYQSIVTTQAQRYKWLEEWTSENIECNGGQSIINVPDDLFHDGPYFDIRMGDCSSSSS